MNISKYLNLELFYYKKFYDIGSSKIILNNLLSNINWTNDKVKMYGKSLILKRRVAWYADSGKSYTYSGLKTDQIPFTKELNSINEIAKMRIFEIYDTKINEAWFKNIPKISTNEELQFVIPINPKSGLIMSSYNENLSINQNYWLNLYNKSKKDFKNTLNKMFRIQIVSFSSICLFVYFSLCSFLYAFCIYVFLFM